MMQYAKAEINIRLSSSFADELIDDILETNHLLREYNAKHNKDAPYRLQEEFTALTHLLLELTPLMKRVPITLNRKPKIVMKE